MIDVKYFFSSHIIVADQPNVNTKEMGRLGLTGAEEDLIVLFMKTLTDR